MTFSVGRIAGLVLMGAATLAAAAAQSTPMQCVANAASTPPMRSAEITARVGEIVISCTGGTPTPVGQAVPTVDFLVYLNGTYTGRTTGAFTESLLLIDEPMPQSQVPCTTDPSLCGWTGGSNGPNVFQGKVLAPNAVAFYGVPLDPGGSSVRVFRITNLRVNAAEFPPPQSVYPVQVTAEVTATGLTVEPSQPVIVGYLQTDLQASVRTAAGATTGFNPNGVELPNCTTVTKQRVANLRFSEKFGTAFQAANWAYDAVTGTAGAPNIQATPGTIYNTEAGFFNPNFPAANNLNKAGLADFGTRLRAEISNLPAGATIYVSTVAVVYTNGVPAPASGSQEQARLTASETGAFAPVAATETLDGIPVAVLPVTQGTATAVWEMVQSSPGVMSDVDFPVWISFPGNSVGLGTASVTMRMGPVSTEMGASDTAPVARYADAPQTMPLLTILDMCPSTQYLVTTSPAFLPVVVDGQTYTSPKSFPWTPGSTHTIGAAAAVPGGVTGARWLSLGWSDAGAATHTITVPQTPATYVATYKLQYLLDVKAVPPEGGTMAVTPPSVDGYYDPGTNVRLDVTLNANYSFGEFSGDMWTLGGTTAYATMSQPHSETATFLKAGPVSSTIGVTPSSGSGASARFEATFEGSQGAQSLKWAQLLVAAGPDGGDQPFCFLHFDAQARQFWLYSDIDGFFQGPISPGTPSAALQGSDCGFDPSSYSGWWVNGARLNVRAELLFRMAGARNVYLRAMDDFGVDTGWVQHGTWTQEAPATTMMEVAPANGSAAEQIFHLSYSQATNNTFYSVPLGWQQFLIAADSTGGGQPFCFVHYDVAGGEFWMYSSDVGFFVGPVKAYVGSNALDSSACSMHTATSGPAHGGPSSKVLDLQLTLKAPMGGAKKVYMRELNALHIDSGWLEVGTTNLP